MIFKKKKIESKASRSEIDPAKEKCHCGSGKRYENCHGLVEEQIMVAENNRDELAEVIARDDWNSLYKLSKRLIEDQPREEIPFVLFFTACHLAKPTKINDLTEFDFDAVTDVEETARWLETLPDSACKNMLYAVTFCFSDVEKSIKILEEELERRPSAEVYLMLAISYSGQAKAIEYFDQAIELDSTNALALLRRGQIAQETVQRGDSAKANPNFAIAEDHLLRAVNVQESLVDAHQSLANLYADAGDDEGRKKHLEAMVQHDPGGVYGEKARKALENKSIFGHIMDIFR